MWCQDRDGANVADDPVRGGRPRPRLANWGGWSQWMPFPSKSTWMARATGAMSRPINGFIATFSQPPKHPNFARYGVVGSMFQRPQSSETQQWRREGRRSKTQTGPRGMKMEAVRRWFLEKGTARDWLTSQSLSLLRGGPMEGLKPAEPA